MRGGEIAAVVAVAALALAGAAPASAGSWLPHPADATWTYSWSDTAYSPTPTKEKVTVKAQKGNAFTLEWTTDKLGNPPDAVTSAGTVSFQDTISGLVNTTWASTPPPDSFPVLCAATSSCANSLASTWYNVIWGNGHHMPVFTEPLLKGVSWTSTGGANDDVTSSSDYLGVQRVSVPAFSQPVPAAVIRSEITQEGALGDPYGSGLRTVWWVYGVGPVKVVFKHAGGTDTPTTTSELVSTSLTPQAPPPDANYFPFRKGLELKYSWTNSRYFEKPVVERFTIDAVATGSARFTVASVSGPIKIAGAYGYTDRLDGVTSIWASTKAALIAKLPPLGPKSLPADKRRHFFTPFDLMNYGFNPVIPAYPQIGAQWRAKKGSRDFAVFGVTGKTKVIGIRTVTVPAGKFRALVVQSNLKQPGFPFGSGTRTSWFAPGRGLVKLVFRHADGSVSRVELLK